MRIFKYAIVFLLPMIVFMACSEDNGNEDTNDETPVPTGEAPSGLVYSPDAVNVLFGEESASDLPSVEGETPISFSIKNNPSDQILINESNGVITSTSDLAVGNYTLTVTAQNTFGSTDFEAAYSINVTQSLPSTLSYQPNTIRYTQGETAQTNAPVIEGGTPPFNFMLKDNPNDGFSINNEGIIFCDENVPAGVYDLSVSVSKASERADFNDVLEVTVEGISSSVTFNDNVKPLLVRKCAPCHTTGAQARMGMDWEEYQDTKDGINDVIRTVQNGSMPPSNNNLTDDEINLLIQWRDAGMPE